MINSHVFSSQKHLLKYSYNKKTHSKIAHREIFLRPQVIRILSFFIAIVSLFVSYVRHVVESIFSDYRGYCLFLKSLHPFCIDINIACNNEYTVNNRAMPSIGFKGFGLVMAASSPRSWAWLRRGHIYFLASVRSFIAETYLLFDTNLLNYTPTTSIVSE